MRNLSSRQQEGSQEARNKRCLISAPSGVDRWFAMLQHDKTLKNRTLVIPTEQSDEGSRLPRTHHIILFEIFSGKALNNTSPPCGRRNDRSGYFRCFTALLHYRTNTKSRALGERRGFLLRINAFIRCIIDFHKQMLPINLLL